MILYTSLASNNGRVGYPRVDKDVSERRLEAIQIVRDEKVVPPALLAPPKTVPSGADMVTSLFTTMALASGANACANTLMPVAAPFAQPQSIELCVIRYEPEPTIRMASAPPVTPVTITFRSADARPPMTRKLIAGSVLFLKLFAET